MQINTAAVNKRR